MPIDLRNLSIAELEKVEKGFTKKDKRLQKEEKRKQEITANTKKKIQRSIKKRDGRLQPKPKQTKIKTFEDYFQECIKNKTIPPDTPSYLRKALERAIKEYNQGIIKEKSALDEFANKYVVKGETGITPFEFFRSKSTYLKDFFTKSSKY